MSPGAPTRIGPYEVLGSLGAGGMGEVYHARDPHLSRDLALKVIRPDRVERDESVDQLLREAILASSLNHPNIVTIYETGTSGSDRYVAMELVLGASLRETAANGVGLDRAVDIARQIAEALAAAHAKQIVHRDIKPENIIVRTDGYVKVLDFGLARARGDRVREAVTQSTANHKIQGTIGYMAPEQARGEKASEAADVFALGVVLYELVTGRHPFEAPSALGMMHRAISDIPAMPSSLNPAVPSWLEEAIFDMLQKEPRLRPSAAEVMTRLSLRPAISTTERVSSDGLIRRVSSPTALVGRRAELETLVDELDRARAGSGRMIVVSGEAGMGKTTLLEAFLGEIDRRGLPVRLGRGRCSERLAGSEAYLPVLEALDSLQAADAHGSVRRLMRTLAPSWYARIIPASENASSAAQLAADTALGSQERLKREIAALVEELARMHPVVLCLDDVHWADAATVDLVAYLAHRMQDQRVLVIATCRPSELAQARHPFLPLQLDLTARGICRQIVPGLLDCTAVDDYLALQFPENAFPRELAALILRRTEGHPLFMADLIRELRRRDVLRPVDGRWTVATELAELERELPESIRSLIRREIDALDEADSRLLSAASVQGLDFDTAVLARSIERSVEEVEDGLERLEREHALVRFVDESEYPRGTLTLRYRFAHHMYQNAFYGALRATRRAALSRSVADALVEHLGEQAATRAADLAILLETARDRIRAATYFAVAAQAAARLYAHEETVRLAERGLALLAREPDSEARAEAELALQMMYSLAIKTSQGYAVADVGKAYARARVLCRQVQNPARVVPVLLGLAAHHIVSGEIETSRDVALEMLDLFERLGDRNLRMMGEWSLGAALFHLGELEPAHEHLTRGLALYDPAFHGPRVWETGIEPGVFCRCEISRTLTLRGQPDSGLSTVREAVVQARALEHPQPLAFALLFQMLVHLTRREAQDVLETYAQLEELCRQKGIAQELQWAAPLHGWALNELGETRGLAEIESALEAHKATRMALLRPYYFLLFADSLCRAGRLDDAERALSEAGAVARATRQEAYDSTHHRIDGDLHLARGREDDAERAYRQAIALADGQGARWLALRAAVSLATMFERRGRRNEGLAVLAPMVERLTEGHTTRDYLNAKALLAEA